MAKLTKGRQVGRKIRYISSADRDELVQKLGAIEHQAEEALAGICDGLCRHKDQASCQWELDFYCDSCPMAVLAELIGL